jgi:hypothetical protein
VGHDQISQTIYPPESGVGGRWDEGETHMFGIENQDSLLFVLSPKDGARAGNRLGWRFDYEHQHHFIEHEHEKCG